MRKKYSGPEERQSIDIMLLQRLKMFTLLKTYIFHYNIIFLGLVKITYSSYGDLILNDSRLTDPSD